ncbi:cyclic nucleotide-binding domain-containing protein, partial [Bosea sp. (in: a-proteobacteria)]
DKPEEVYCVLEGEVELSHEAPEGRSKTFRLASGSLIGDVPLLCNQTYAARSTAKTDVVALRLPRALFFELLDNIPEFSVALSRDLAGRLYRLADSVLHGEKTH